MAFYQLLIVSQHADRFAQLLAAQDLPDLDIRTARSTEAAFDSCAEADILFGAPGLIAPLLESCVQLQWVQSSWAGIQPLLVETRRDYLLTGLRDIFGPQMAEYVTGWILALQRNILDRARARSWNDSADEPLAGKRLGIMGTGSIGREVAHAASALHMQVSGLNRDGRATENFERCYSSAQRLEFAEGLDYLVAMMPHTRATDNVIDAKLLNITRRGAVLINAGRANCIVDADLLDALKEGQLRAAVLDVLREEPLPDDHPLWRVENLYITSHTAAPTVAAPIAGVFCDNYRRFHEGEPLFHLIDFNKGY